MGVFLWSRCPCKSQSLEKGWGVASEIREEGCRRQALRRSEDRSLAAKPCICSETGVEGFGVGVEGLGVEGVGFGFCGSGSRV